MSLSVLIAAGGASWESDAVTTLEASPAVSGVRRCVDVLDLVATAAAGHAHAALLSIDLPGLDTDVVHRLVEARVTPIGIAAADDAYAVSRFDALGVGTRTPVSGLDRLDDLVVTAEDLPDTPEELGPLLPGSETTQAGRGRIVTVWGPTGAPGRSTVAMGFACEAAAAGTPTLLIDADTYGGAAAQMLAVLDEVSGLLAAARSADTGRLGPAELARHVRQVNDGLRVLTGIGRADRWPQLRVGSFERILDVARQLASVVIVDTGFCIETDEELSYDTAAPRRNAVTLSALERADVVVAVGSADPLGLTRLTRGIHEVRDRSPDLDLRVVVNRMRDSLGWSEDQIADMIARYAGPTPIGFLPHDQAAVDRAWVDGTTLTEGRDSALRQAIGELATALLGTRRPRQRRFVRRR